MHYSKLTFVFLLTLSITLSGCSFGFQGPEQELVEKPIQDETEQIEECKREIIDMGNNWKKYRNECLGIEFEFENKNYDAFLNTEKSDDVWMDISYTIDGIEYSSTGPLVYVYLTELDNFEDYLYSLEERYKKGDFHADNQVEYWGREKQINKNGIEIHKFKIATINNVRECFKASNLEAIQKCRDSEPRSENRDYYIQIKNNKEKVLKLDFFGESVEKDALDSLKYIN